MAWQLTDAKYTVELDVWDWVAGRNFVTAMSDALDRCERVVALFSAAYFGRDRYTTEEWSASVLHVPGVAEGKPVPVRVENVLVKAMPAVLQPLVSRDIFGMDEEQAPAGAAGCGSGAVGDHGVPPTSRCSRSGTRWRRQASGGSRFRGAVVCRMRPS